MSSPALALLSLTWSRTGGHKGDHPAGLVVPDQGGGDDLSAGQHHLHHVADGGLGSLLHRVVEVVGVDQVWDVGVQVLRRVVVQTVAVVTGRV